jgi:hypothetical protein
MFWGWDLDTVILFFNYVKVMCMHLSVVTFSFYIFAVVFRVSTRRTATENLLSRRVRFGARIITR